MREDSELSTLGGVRWDSREGEHGDRKIRDTYTIITDSSTMMAAVGGVQFQ